MEQHPKHQYWGIWQLNILQVTKGMVICIIINIPVVQSVVWLLQRLIGMKLDHLELA